MSPGGLVGEAVVEVVAAPVEVVVRGTVVDGVPMGRTGAAVVGVSVAVGRVVVDSAAPDDGPSVPPPAASSVLEAPVVASRASRPPEPQLALAAATNATNVRPPSRRRVVCALHLNWP
jgi:hypothetical protein